MVNFNPGEFRGFHGRWMLGGPHHPHLRHRKGGVLGSFERAAAGSAASETRRAERSAVRAERTASTDIRRTTEATARARGISSSMMRQAERQAGVRAGGAERAATRESTRRPARRKRSVVSAYRRARYGRYGHRGFYGRGGGGGLFRGIYLAQMLHRRSQRNKALARARLPVPHVAIPAVKKAPKKKAAAKKKAPAKAKARPRTIAPPKAPTGRRTTGARGKGAGQKVTPSAQVMANLAGYVNAPGGKRAGIGVAGRASASSTGRTAGSRVGVRPSSGRGSLAVRRRH